MQYLINNLEVTLLKRNGYHWNQSEQLTLFPSHDFDHNFKHDLNYKDWSWRHQNLVSNTQTLAGLKNTINSHTPKSVLIIIVFRNNIEELSQVEFLALCSSLTSLTLEGNPLCITPNPDEASVCFTSFHSKLYYLNWEQYFSALALKTLECAQN